MPIITISRGSYSYGKETAEKLAEKLGYECISREILMEASEQFHVPELKLVRAIHDSPTILERFTHGKEKYVAFIRAALLKHLQKDNIIYHGFAGQFFLPDISHVLKVRIIANLDKRIEVVMKRDHVSAEKALYILKKDDEERRKWSLYLYGMDTWDPRLYDLVFHIDKLSINDVVNMIMDAVKQPAFQTTEASQKKLTNLALAAQIEAAMVNEFPIIHASIENDKVMVNVTGSMEEREAITRKIENTIRRMMRIDTIQVNIIPSMKDIQL